MRTFNVLIFCIFFLNISCTPQNEEKDTGEKKSPNIIYILADDLGYGDVDCFNDEGKIPTPNIDAMASNGIMFTDAHTSSAVCTPTRYGILTGRYNWRTRLKKSVLSGFSKSLIKQERITVAELLKQQGYTTAFIGKWHLGWDWDIKDSKSNKLLDDWASKVVLDIDFSTPVKNGPGTHGFDYSYGFCGSLDMAPYVWVENGKATSIPTKTTQSVDDKGFWREGLTSDDFDHTLVLQDITDKTIKFINDNANTAAPFFVYMPLPAPHTPILPTTEFLGKSNTNMYGDFVMQVDDVVRQVREALKKNGVNENTLVIFTSDNGCSPRADFEELKKVGHSTGGMFRGNKADIYEAGHRVPFVVEWPGVIAKNEKNDITICTTDLLATCADITGYKMKDSEGEDSYSMLPYFIGATSSPSHRQYTVHHSIDGSFAIREGDWKLILCAGSGGWSYPTPKQIEEQKLDLPKYQLYNLKEDIGEKKNLIGQNPGKALELKEAMIKIIQDGRSTPGKKQQNDGMQDWEQFDQLLIEKAIE